MCFLVNNRCLQHPNTLDKMQAVLWFHPTWLFSLFQGHPIWSCLAVILWLIFKRFTTAIRSPIVACLSPSIAFVARPVVISFSCYEFTWRNCENPTDLLFHGWFSNWVICKQISPLYQGFPISCSLKILTQNMQTHSCWWGGDCRIEVVLAAVGCCSSVPCCFETASKSVFMVNTLRHLLR